MGILARAGDLVYTFRFLRLLTTAWKDTTAFKLGIIDENGKRIKDAKITTSEQKSAYNTFHRLVFNIKRLIAKAPGGSSKIGTYVAALFLMKEKYNISEKNLTKILKECNIETIELSEEVNSWFILKDGCLAPGIYKLKEDKIINSTCHEGFVYRGDKVRIVPESDPQGEIFGIKVYNAIHYATGQIVYVTANELVR
jgi:hypothetical protein